MSIVGAHRDEIAATPETLRIGVTILVGQEKFLQRVPESGALLGRRTARPSVTSLHHAEVAAGDAFRLKPLDRFGRVLPIVKKKAVIVLAVIAFVFIVAPGLLCDLDPLGSYVPRQPAVCGRLLVFRRSLLKADGGREALL